MRKWVQQAIDYGETSQAELTRKLNSMVGWSDNRSILNKILTGKRELGAKEMFDISAATGYPVPKLGVPEDWRALLHEAIDQARKQGASLDEVHLEFEAAAPLDVRHKLRLLSESDLSGMHSVREIVERDAALSGKGNAGDIEGNRR